MYVADEEQTRKTLSDAHLPAESQPGRAQRADPWVVDRAQKTAAWRATGGKAVEEGERCGSLEGAWALHGGRLGKVYRVQKDWRGLGIVIRYADDGAYSGALEPAALAPAGPAQVAKGEAILADPGLPARRTAAWRRHSSRAPGEGAWAVHSGRLGKVFLVRPKGAGLYGPSASFVLNIRYADDGAMSELLEPRNVAAASPTQVAKGEAMLDGLGTGPS
jgi:hypothetical protein